MNNTIFEVKVYEFDTHHRYWRTAIFDNKKLEFKITNRCIGYFTTIKNAEKFIKEFVKFEDTQEQEWYNEKRNLRIGFKVIEHLPDEGYVNTINLGKTLSEFKSCRSYLADGTLNCISFCDDITECFTGRTTPVRVHKNEFALHVRNKRAVICRITHDATTKEWWDTHIKSGVKGDIFDDGYTAVYKNFGHDHPFSPDIFPLTFPATFKFTDKMQQDLIKEHKEYFEECGITDPID